MTRLVVGMLSVGLMFLGAGVVFGQTTSTGSGQAYPNKAIRIVTSGVGGGSDFDARLIAQGISVPLGQPVIVDNRVMVSSAEIVSKAPPDGYTLLLVGSTFYIEPLLRQQPYDPVKDFSPVVTVSTNFLILVVHPGLGVNSVKELIALAKAKPGQLNYASVSVGGPPSLSAALFASIAGVNIVRVPYKSTGLSLNGVLGGEAQLVFVTASAAMPHVKSGKLRALGVTSAQPSALVPGVPPIAASLPGYESVSMTPIFAPAKTPAAIINRLNQEIVRFLNTAEAKERFFNVGEETVGNSPEELAAMMKSEMAKWAKVIKDANIKAD